MPNEIVKTLKQELAETGTSAAWQIRAAQENILARRRGEIEATFSIPRGTFNLVKNGETIKTALPPYYAAFPLKKGGGSWFVPPANFQIQHIDGNTSALAKLRPTLLLTVQPTSLNPHDPVVELGMDIAGWNPKNPSTLYTWGQETTVFSLARKLPAAQQQTPNQLITIPTDQITSSLLINRIAQTAHKNEFVAGLDTEVDVLALYDGLRRLTELSPGLTDFWKKAQARTTIGSLIATGDSNLLSLAIQSLLDVNVSNKDDFIARQATLLKALKSEEVTDWDSLTLAALNAFRGVDYPVTLSFGWTGLQAFVNQVMDASVIDENAAKQIVSKMTGTPLDQVNMIRGLNGNPLQWILADPRWIAAITTGVRDWIELAIEETDFKIAATRALVEAGKAHAEVILAAANAFRDGILDEKGAVTEIAKWIGEEKARNVLQRLASLTLPNIGGEIDSEKLQEKLDKLKSPEGLGKIIAGKFKDPDSHTIPLESRF